MSSDRPLAQRLLNLIRQFDAWALLFLALVGVGFAASHGEPPVRTPTPMAAFINQAALSSLVFSPDGRLVATADVDGAVNLVDLESGEEWSVPGAAPGSEPSLAFSADGRLLALMAWGSPIRIWDVVAHQVRSTLNVEGVRTVCFATDGTLLAITNLKRREVTKWDWAHDRQETMLGGQLTRALATAFSPGGRYLAASFLDGSIKLWDLPTGQEIATMRPPSRPTVALAFSNDGSVLASAGSEDSVVRLWDASCGKLRGALPDCGRTVTALAFTPDGSRLMLAGVDGIIHVRDVSTGRDRVAFQASEGVPRVLAVSPDGRTLAAGGMGRKTRLWDLARVMATNRAW